MYIFFAVELSPAKRPGQDVADIRRASRMERETCDG